MSAGTAPPCSSTIISLSRLIARAFCGDSPQGRMMAWICSTGTAAMACGVSARANRAGVTWLTRSSVHWALSNTATSRVNGSL